MKMKLGTKEIKFKARLIEMKLKFMVSICKIDKISGLIKTKLKFNIFIYKEIKFKVTNALFPFKKILTFPE